MRLDMSRNLAGLLAAPLVPLMGLSFMINSAEPAPAAGTAAAAGQHTSQEVARDAASEGELEIPNGSFSMDVIWLARAIYSETKRPDEQELVAWVVRNRVETRYRRASTYREVVLDPWQFSAFNRDAPRRAHYLSLREESHAAGWHKALEVAQRVYRAPAEERPFSLKTRHFFSERSMVGRSFPEWAEGKRPVALDRDIDPKRFRFFANIA
jgi:hypothetical protein